MSKSISLDVVRPRTKKKHLNVPVFNRNRVLGQDQFAWFTKPPNPLNPLLCGQWMEASESWCNLFSSYTRMGSCTDVKVLQEPHEEHFVLFPSPRFPVLYSTKYRRILHTVNTWVMKPKVIRPLHCSTRHDTWG